MKYKHNDTNFVGYEVQQSIVCNLNKKESYFAGLFQTLQIVLLSLV